MAERVAGKAKKRAQKAAQPAKKAAGKAVPGGAETLEQENARLKRELAAALARVKVMEERHDALANRIDWAIDSLHSLLDE